MKGKLFENWRLYNWPIFLFFVFVGIINFIGYFLDMIEAGGFEAFMVALISLILSLIVPVILPYLIINWFVKKRKIKE